MAEFGRGFGGFEIVVKAAFAVKLKTLHPNPVSRIILHTKFTPREFYFIKSIIPQLESSFSS
jgi:hypothetical protein